MDRVGTWDTLCGEAIVAPVFFQLTLGIRAE
jgi:hypothetical protein